jgi:hypothetical protein
MHISRMTDLVQGGRLRPRLLLLPHQRPDRHAGNQADAGQSAHNPSRDRTRLALRLRGSGRGWGRAVCRGCRHAQLGSGATVQVFVRVEAAAGD